MTLNLSLFVRSNSILVYLSYFGIAPVTELVEQQLAVIDAKIAALNQFRQELDDIQRQAQIVLLDVIMDKERVCRLIENREIRGKNE